MTDSDLEARYRAYLAALNDRRTDQLEPFVHEELTYNDELITRQQYRELLDRSAAAIPDLVYDVRLLVVAGDHVACRLLFDCTPEGEFLGIPPSGRRVTFAEHVFYRFRDGRIASVCSLIDRAAVEDQVRG